MSLLAIGTHGKVGRSYHYLNKEVFLSRECVLGETALVFLLPLQLWGVLALPSNLDFRAVLCSVLGS